MARRVFQLEKTAAMAPQSCATGSSGKGLPVCCLTSSLNSRTRAWMTGTGRSISRATPHSRLRASRRCSKGCLESSNTTAPYICTNRRYESQANAGFPAWHPDGKTIIYRIWGSQDTPETRGLRSINLADNSVKVLTTGFDNFPFISPTGDRVVFTRRMPDFDFEVFTMNVDGSDVKRITSTAGADAHATWTADGREIWFESSRTGFKDEAAMFDVSPQPYAQVFLMDRNGGKVRQLTDSKWEDSMGTYVKMP